MCFLARAAPSGESLWGEGLVWLIGAMVFASCMPRVQLYVNACNAWPQFALQHHWLLPINCHFLRLYSAAGRGISAVSSAIEKSDLYLFYLYLQITPCVPLLPSHRASPPFGWHSFYRPTEGRRPSRPGLLVTYRNKAVPPEVEPGHSHRHQSQY